MTEPWWKSAVFYQVYPRSFADSPFRDWADGGKAYRAKYPVDSFADSTGDGVGDLPGITRRLDHLAWLGVDAVWICPFYRSPMTDFGYDVADYCDVDPLFGTSEDFDRLLAEAHERGIRVIVDWVPNHTSDQHPWFVEAQSSRESTKRDWYVWVDGEPTTLPNNWKAAFGGDAWTWDDATGQWYLHLFLPTQPDLNWRNPEVAAAMHETLRFWVDRGVDGFRIDVVQGLAKDLTFPDDPPDQVLPHAAVNDCADTHEILRGLRRLAESYSPAPLLLGEVYLLSTKTVAGYVGDGDELHLAFDFTSLYAPWEAGAWRRCIELVEAEFGARAAWPTWTLSNHDNPRHRTRYGGSERRAGAAAVLLLTLRGAPFVYYGEELGLEDAVVPPEREVDPGGRDGCRSPLPWDGSPGHGWAGAEPWLPWSPEPETRNVADLRARESSILHLYRRILAARHASPALAVGSWRALEAPAGVLGYEREQGEDRRVVLVNFTSEATDVGLDGRWQVEVDSDGLLEGEGYPGRLAGDAAVILRP